MERYTDLRNKRIRIEYSGNYIVFKLKQKRSYTVLLKILEFYPKFMDIHELDGILNDPNRALTDLRNADGFAYFLNERKNDKRNLEVQIDVEKLFTSFKDQYGEEICISFHERLNPTSILKRDIKRKFDSKCNITGIKVYDKLANIYFLKNLQITSYDHRIPLFKGDCNQTDIRSWQLLSELVNREKNKLCNACLEPNCKVCALAFPEEYDKIICNGQDISKFRGGLKNGLSRMS